MRPLLAFVIVASSFVAPGASASSSYDNLIVDEKPALFLPMSSPRGARERDLARGRHNGTYFPKTNEPKKTRMPNGDTATVFDGVNQYLEVASAPSFSVKHGGALTIEMWMRPDTLQFTHSEGEGFVYFAGKGESHQEEWACRMYSKQNSASRPNRISDYVFNLEGGLGSGSYFQDVVQTGVWIHYAAMIHTRHTPSISIFKNGVLRKTTPLSQFNVTPEPGDAPVRIATRELTSFFKGAIGKFALYSRALTAAQLLRHVEKMR